MMYEIIFEYISYGTSDADKIFERDFKVSLVELGTIFLSESEINIIDSHKFIILNGIEYNVYGIKLSVYNNMEKKYLISLVNQDHLPF